ncbi:MAG: hypothetical protein Q8K93_31380 [Reyranella sp.]|uniref:hypothetical protein n=1 Tax=Reyranella sp. TaxID=1929291 RepID=UPI00272F4A37|nr:hypothetical protein [Reyranella sp.]MDP1966692.1 hypothetical protein [Reyranella sp.]MDP2372731.1 hypothetical protein [Reyranella sp.]
MTSDNSTEDTTETPSVEPAINEQLAPENTAFAAECMAGLNNFPPFGDWKLGVQLVTHSDTWGDVWRADFEIGGKSLAPLINRIVCWRKADGTIPIMVAIGQSVPPLRGK